MKTQTRMNTQKHKESYEINYQRIIFNHTKDTQKRLQKKVAVIFDAIKELFLEKEGGVYVKELGYLAHIRSPKKVYNDISMVYETPRFPYLFTDLSDVPNLRKFTMEGMIDPKLNNKTKNYKLYYSLIKEYKNK